MRKLLGPHVAGQWANKLDLLRQWQPPFVLMLQPDADKVRQLRDACPAAIIVGRFYHEDSYYSDNIRTRPKEFALEMHRQIIDNPATPLLDYVQSNNETNQDWAGIQQLNVYTETWMAHADQANAYKCAILAFGVGNPDLPAKPGDPAGFDGRMLYWQQVLPSLNYAQNMGHLLLLHAYGFPDLFRPDADWYIYRYERQVQASLRALGINRLKYAYGEIGIDRLIVGEKGGYKSVPTSDDGYVNQLLQWERDQQNQSQLLGGAIFTFGDSGGWNSYDITSTNVAALLATHYTDSATDYEGLGVAADKKQTLFIPFASAPPPALPLEWDERLTARGVTVQTPPNLKPGQQYWRVVKARWYNEQEAGGRHHIYIEATEGTPWRVTWPSGSAPGYTNGKSGFDASNYPMSSSLNEFSVQIRGDMDIPSETVAGIGMGADGNPSTHTSTGVVFHWATMPQAQTTPPPISTGTEPPQATPAGIIDPRVAQAILAVESGGRTHGNDGRVLIRFEAHIFRDKASDKGRVDQFFRFDASKPWTGQERRLTLDSPWLPIHTGRQLDEYDAFAMGQMIDFEAAHQSISMGAAQIMGFNHARIGYPSASAMLKAFESAPMQTIGFVNFSLSDPGLMDAIRRKDWREIARRYNGAGAVDSYSVLLEQAYNEVSQ